MAEQPSGDYSLQVFSGRALVGRLTFDPQADAFGFRYADDWRARTDAFQLSPHIRFDRPASPVTVRRFVHNLLPEGQALDVAATYSNVTKSNIFGLIHTLGGECAGALRFLPEHRTPSDEVVRRRVSYQELQTRIDERDRQPFMVWDGQVRVSIAGYQDKLQVVRDGGELYLVDGALSSTHILKPPPVNPLLPNMVANEHFCMRLVNRIGQRRMGQDWAARVDLLRVPTPVLCVERFDRRLEGGQVRGIHIIDGCQALDRPVDHKYERNFGTGADVRHVRDGVSFEVLGSLRRDGHLANVAVDLRQMAYWAVTTLLLGNSDAHGKNLSFFARYRSLTVAPFYDLVCTALYDGKRIALGFGIDRSFPSGGFAMLRQSGWLACAGVLGILAGCAQAPARGSGSPSDLNGLYAQLDQASAEYDQALEQARRGDNAQSQKTLEAALDAMRGASDRCVNTPDCDAQRFLSAYDRALRLKDGSFLGTEDDDQALDAEDQTAAGAEPGVLTTLPEAQRTMQLLHDHKLSDLVATNGPVQAALQVWLTRLRPNLVRAYVDYQYLRYQMWPAFHEAGLPEAILFGIVAKESGGNVHAVSRSGAAGPLQFMPATGSRFGLNTIDGFDQRFDPTMAAQAGAAYLNEQLARLNDNLALVLAAYNGGEGRVGRLASGATDANFWEPDVYLSLSAETREYVPMVLAAAWLFLHPQRYNLHFPKVDGTPGYVELAKAASLNELSVCLGDDI